jgi:HSP20 family protein
MNCNPQNQQRMTTVKFRPQGSLVTPFDELIHGFFGRDIGHVLGSDELHKSAPRVNIVERPDGFVLDLLAPGFTKEELKLSMEKDTLTISAEKGTEPALAEGERYTRREFGKAAFKRSFRLPEHALSANISAEFTNGVLHITIPKAEPAKPAVHEINIH